MRRWGWAILVTVLVATAGGALALGQDLPKLPAGVTLQQAPDSPGKVTFQHASHMGDRADCTSCHPKVFSILKKPSASKDRITHAKMEKGRQCGACHNGKVSFGFDDCTMCHK